MSSTNRARAVLTGCLLLGILLFVAACCLANIGLMTLLDVLRGAPV